MIIRDADEVPARQISADGARGLLFRMLIGEDQGAENFYMRRMDLAPGGCTPHHAHPWEHEIYVLAGAGEVLCQSDDGGEQARPIRPGQVLYMPPDEKHQFRNTGDDVLKFLCLVPAHAS